MVLECSGLRIARGVIVKHLKVCILLISDYFKTFDEYIDIRDDNQLCD